MTEQKIKQVQLLWNSLTDELRWKAVPELQREIPKLIVHLDNDDTYIYHKGIDTEIFLLQFDEFIGWSDGIQTMLKAFNIKAEPV